MDVEKAESPPSYDSLYGRMEAAKKTFCEDKGFAMTACRILACSIALPLFLAIVVAVPVSSIVIGALYLDDCPAERYIPIYLIVSGCFTILKDLCKVAHKIKRRGSDCKKDKCCKEDKCGKEDKCRKEDKCCKEDQDRTDTDDSNCFSQLIGLFLFAWFIAGNVWVYRLYGKWSSDSTASNYCHPTVYNYAFWLMAVVYMVLGICLIGGLVLIFLYCIGATPKIKILDKFQAKCNKMCNKPCELEKENEKVPPTCN